MKKLTALLLTLTLFTSSSLYAQVSQTAYAEIEIDRKDGSDFQVLTAGELGLLCFLESQEHQKGGQKELQLRMFDDTLGLKWEKNYLMPYGEEILYNAYDGKGTAYFLTQQKEDQYRAFGLTLSDGLLSTSTLPEIKSFLITDFQAYSGNLLIGGRINNHPLVLLKKFNDETASPIVLPSISQLDADLLDVVIDSLYESIYVLMDKTKPITEQGIYLNRYDMDGNILENTLLPFSNEYNIISHRAHATAVNGELMLYGTYGLGNDESAQGVYSFKIKEGQLTQNRFYDFGYLKNFFKYLPEKQEERRVRRVKEQLEKGKRMRHRYKCFVHDLQLMDDRVILMLETYDANSDFRRDGWNMGNGYGSWFDPSLRRYMNTLGYFGFMPMSFTRNRWQDRSNFPTSFEYKHAVVLGFNKDGELLWDNSYNFSNDTESSFPVEQAQAIVWQDSAVVLQVNEEEALFKTFGKSNYIEENDTIAVKKAHPGDIHDETEYGGVLPWFGKHFINSGLRRIRNRSTRELNRYVFYLSRYTYTGIKEEREESREMDKQ